MIQKDEVLLKYKSKWLHFTNPYRVLTTTRLDDVLPAMEDMERLVNQNGWYAAGFLSYEAAPAFDPALKVLPVNDFPLAWFGLYPPPREIELSFGQTEPIAAEWRPTTERERYNAAIEQVKDQIARGKTYQVNYTMRLQAEFASNAWDLFKFLAQHQNKYAAFIDIGRYAICSASPELFFHLNGEAIYSRPMKGTLQRGRTTAEDLEQAGRLKASAKNRAENVMIVDMIRNDLGRIAEVGSVRVPEVFAVETYPTLLQMTSTVQARTRASIPEIFKALFPCASITGAPKVSTMKIIAELETSPRKIYTGSIGFLTPDRKAQFNVAIRTALIDRENALAEYGVGGGIVWDSTSADEYSEALLKARVLTERPQEFSLLETMLWTPQDGYFLLEKHLARMGDSARYFGFEFREETIRAQLMDLARGFTSIQRVRALLDRAGSLTIEFGAFAPPRHTVQATLASQPIDSVNPFHFHKTTRREIYPTPPAGRDILLFNERNELTEFTIGNLVVEMDGAHFTPPLSCGVLAGTFRAHLLETGQVRERILHKDELKRCSKVFLVNSVRTWVEAVIDK